jgi:hypothetical protein
VGLLCPHMYIKTKEGNEISLRQLNTYVYEKLKEQGKDDPERFCIVLRFKEKLDREVDEQVNLCVQANMYKRQRYDIRVMSISGKNKAEKEGSSDSEDVIYASKISNLLDLLDCDKNNVVVMRSDATIIAKV